MSDKPHRNHSFSRLNVFSDQCQRRYAYDAIYPQPFGNDATDRGSHVHAGLECWAQRWLAGDDNPVTSAKIANFMRDLPDKKVKYFLTDEQFDDYLNRMVPVLADLNPLSAEKWFRDVGDLPIVGKIDLIALRDGNKTVVDWKTTSNPARIPTKLQAKRSLQLKIYCLAEGVRHAGFVYMMSVGEPVSVFVEFTEKELEIARRYLTEQIHVLELLWSRSKGGDDEGYDMSVFALAAPSHPLCSSKWCPHWKRCLGKD